MILRALSSPGSFLEWLSEVRERELKKDSSSREPSPSTCAATPKSAATKRRVSGALASSAGEQRGKAGGGSR